MKIEDLTRWAARVDARHGPDASSWTFERMPDADDTLQRRATYCAILRGRRADRRREYHERAAGFQRGDSVRDVRECEMEPVDIDPFRYLDCLGGIVGDIVRAVIIDGEKQTEIARRLGIAQSTISERFREGIEYIREFHGIGR